MRILKTIGAATLALAIVLGASSVRAQTVEVPDPGMMDTCPVCGMLVSKYREWWATIVFTDGHVHHFDGAKDMFKFLFDMGKYDDRHVRENVSDIAVTEYYDLKRIDARQALYVVGSDVYGPMGHEFVPLANREDAEAFMADHAGKRILTFDEVTADLAAKLDQGVFE